MKLLDHVYLLASGALGFDWTDPCDCNVYLIDGGGELALVDTGTGTSVPRILEHLRSHGFSPRQLKYLLLTHLHADHAGGAALLREASGARVAALGEGQAILESGDEEAIDLVQARQNGYYPAEYRFSACRLDQPLRDGEELALGRLRIRVCRVPGHSRLDTAFLVEDPGGHVSLFSGDTVFFGGRISMLNTHDFNLRDLAASIGRLAKERVDSLFAGHLQPALTHGAQHVAKAADCFQRMGVPPSIV